MRLAAAAAVVALALTACATGAPSPRYICQAVAVPLAGHILVCDPVRAEPAP